MNKRTIENFIKAGAFDSLGATRRQQMMVYVQVLDQVNAEKKKSMTGQMSLFDFVGEEEKQDFDVKYPDVGEYDKETLLAFEKSSGVIQRHLWKSLRLSGEKVSRQLPRILRQMMNWAPQE